MRAGVIDELTIIQMYNTRLKKRPRFLIMNGQSRRENPKWGPLEIMKNKFKVRSA